MVRGVVVKRFCGPPKFYSMFYGPRASKVWETLTYTMLIIPKIIEKIPRTKAINSPKGQRDRKKERKKNTQKDRKTERHKDRKTERQKS